MAFYDKENADFRRLKNYRDLGGYRRADGTVTSYGVFARSALPVEYDASDREALLKRGMIYDLDLRTDGEAAAYTDYLSDDDSFVYRRIQFDIVLRDHFYSPEEAAAYYHMLLRLRDNVRQILTYCADAPDGLFFHCHAGKDRGGMIAVLLLLIAGVCDEDIIADYNATYPVYWHSDPPEAHRGTRLLPLRENMEIVLHEFYRIYGDIDGYLDYIALPREKSATIRKKLL